MRTFRSTRSFLIAAACLGCAHCSQAATIQTLGPGTAVTAADRSATFDTLTSSNVVHLDTYSEGGLNVFTSGTSWADDLNLSASLDPFHGAGGADRAFYAISAGNEDWVTIEATDHVKMYALEFMYGNTWSTGDLVGPFPWGNNLAIVEWQTWNDGSLVSSGTIGGSPLLDVGTVLGFSDAAGFDQLLVRATIASSGNPNLQAIALDNVVVQLSPIPEPASLTLLGVGALAFFGRRWSRRRK